MLIFLIILVLCCVISLLWAKSLSRKSRPEDKINELAAALTAPYDSQLSDGKKLNLLKAIADQNSSVQMFFEELHNAKSEDQEWGLNDNVLNHRIAISNQINVLMGENPSPSRYQSEEQVEQMRQSCELQRSRIRNGRINQEDLRFALWMSYQIKDLWLGWKDSPGHGWDRRWTVVEITKLEAWAKAASVRKVRNELEKTKS